VHLRGRRRAGRRETEGTHRPLQVAGLIAALERQQLAQRGLIDLDHADAGALQIGDLVTQGEGDLVGRLSQGLVVAHVRPGQDRHRSGEHPLHRLVGERLRERRPADGDRRGPGDVAPQDRRSRRA
jgi:hypothetical protein